MRDPRERLPEMELNIDMKKHTETISAMAKRIVAVTKRLGTRAGAGVRATGTRGRATGARTVFIAVLAILALAAFAATVAATNLVVGIIFALVFCVGVSVPLLIGFVVGPSLPGWLGEAAATSFLIGPFLGLREVLVNQADDGRYYIEPSDGATAEHVSWGRLAFTKVGVTYDAAQDAFAFPEPPEEEISNLVKEGRLPDGTPYATWDYNRTGNWFVALREAVADGGHRVVRVPIGQALTRLRGAAGTAVGEEAIEEAMKQYGGDKSWGGSGVFLHVLKIVMLLIGLGTGYILWF